METYVHHVHGWHWTRLNNLIDAYDNRETLEADEKFGAHVSFSFFQRAPTSPLVPLPTRGGGLSSTHVFSGENK